MAKSIIKKVFFENRVFIVFDGVYEPAEDTFLIAENLAVNAGEEVLDVGSGCGILSVLSADKGITVVAVDINPDAVKCTKHNAIINEVAKKLEVVRGDFFEPLREGALFDLVLFNAPYLPTENEKPSSWIDYAWSGGKKGRELIDRFVANASKLLKPEGRVLLVQSTLSDINETLKKFAKQRFDVSMLAEKKVAFETITLILAKRRHA